MFSWASSGAASSGAASTDSSAALLVGTVGVSSLPESAPPAYSALFGARTRTGETAPSSAKGPSRSNSPGVVATRLKCTQPPVGEKKKVPAGLRRRGNEWKVAALESCREWRPNLKFAAFQQVPEVLRSLGIQNSSSPSGLSQNFIIDTVSSLKKCSVETFEQIERDLPRTFPDVDFFSNTDIRDSIGRVLRVLAMEYPSVGYVQGMNFLAANMLLHTSGSEDEAFQLLRYLMESPRYRLMHIFEPGLTNLRRMSDILESLICSRFPELFKRFDSIGLEPLFYSQNWIMTLFSYMVPFPELAEIWDRFFRDGWPALFRTMLAVFYLNRDKLLHADFERAAIILRRAAEEPAEDFIRCADRVVLTRDELDLIHRAVAMEPIEIPLPTSVSELDDSLISEETMLDTHRQSMLSQFTEGGDTVFSGSAANTPESIRSVFRKSLSGFVTSDSTPCVQYVQAQSVAFGLGAAVD